MAAGGDTNSNRDTARDVFWRYWTVWNRGFEKWRAHVTRLEEYYLGGGRQWLPEHRAIMEKDGRPCHEVNIVKRAVNTAAAYQMANRVDVSYLPRGGQSDEYMAKVLGKVSKWVDDNAGYRYCETDMFMDGLIQQRGYIDLRMDYSNSALGEIAMESLDPTDCLPDPDARNYDPDTWGDFRIRRFLTSREIESTYGKAAADAVVAGSVAYADLTVFGDEIDHRKGFGGMPPTYARGYGWYEDRPENRRYCIIDQQANEYAMALTAVWPTGEMRVVEGSPRDQLAWLIDNGVQIFRRRMRRVRWQVAAPEVAIIDQWSPYNHMTTVGYFPYFRRGQTVGMVDDMVSPQDMLNKFVSQYAVVVNGSANGGWQGEANSIANMTDEQFVANASQSSLVILRKPGKAKLEKIQPNSIPTGIEKMIEFAHSHGNDVSGVDENLVAPKPQSNISGVAWQSLQYASQQKLAVALDNLARTRRLLHSRKLDLIQRFMGQERLIRVAETDEYGIEQHVPLALNQFADDGSVLNDLTVGEYDVIVSERPMQVTFDNSEYNQLIEMKTKVGIPVPDPMIVKASNVADKTALAEALKEQASAPKKVDEKTQSDIALAQAKAALANSQAVATNIQAQYEAIQTATAIVVTPQSAELADSLLKSGGYIDHDAPPIIPEMPEAAGAATAVPPALPHNTHPLHPPNADVGVARGMTDSPTNPPQV